MYKYLTILSLGLCACSTGTLSQNTAPAAPAPAVAQAPTAVVLTPNTEDNTPLNVELPRGGHAQALRCSDELDCMQKLVGLCTNGYNGGQTLSNGSHTVGVLYRCVTDEEKAQAAQQAAEEQAQEAAWRAAREAQIRAVQQAALKQTPAKK